MDIHALKAFATVAATGSFSQAAEHLCLTQPAVSKRIAALEHQLDVRLFDRIGRKVLLTEAGETLLPRVGRILAELEDGRRALANLSGRVAGRLTVGTSHHIGLHRLPPVLRRFTARYPEVELDLRFMASEAACAAVERGELELGIVTLPPAPGPTLQHTPVWEDPLQVVAGPDHPLSHMEGCTVETLAGHGAILPEAGTYTRDLLERALEPLGIRLRLGLSTNYLETIKMMVSVGLGWSLLPQTMVDKSINPLPVEGLPPLQRTLGVVRHPGRTPSNAGKRLVELLMTNGDGIVPPETEREREE